MTVYRRLADGTLTGPDYGARIRRIHRASLIALIGPIPDA